MPTQTYDLIFSSVLSSSVNSVSFSSIPGTYQDLVLVANFSLNDSGTFVDIRLNNDSNGNYSTQLMQEAGGAASAFVEAGVTQARILGANSLWAGSGFTNLIIANFLDYSASDKHKNILTRANATGEYPGVRALVTRWGNTTPITDITILTGAGYNFLPGSSFSLYGIVG